MDLAAALKRIDAYERLIRLDKPIGALLLLWPTLWAVWIAASGRPRPEVVVIFVMGTILMRSAGCAINDWADRDFDGKVARTRDRPLAAGEIAPKEALAVGAALAACAFCFVLFLNRYRDPAVGRRAGDRRRLPVRQAVPAAAAARPEHRLQLRHSDGLCRDHATRCPGNAGRCSRRTRAMPSPTTPSTRWSTATTT